MLTRFYARRGSVSGFAGIQKLKGSAEFCRSDERCQSTAVGGQQLTSTEVAAALRPFYFLVHPDKFMQFPHEKTVNENSLKQLNEHIDNLRNRASNGSPLQVTFYRRTFANKQPPPASGRLPSSLSAVDINCHQRDDINSVVHRILSSCELSTQYLDKLDKSPLQSARRRGNSKAKVKCEFTSYRGDMEAFWIKQQMGHEVEFDDAEFFKTTTARVRLSTWLEENIDKVNDKIASFAPVRENVNLILSELKHDLGLVDVKLDGSWNASYFRGCLIGFKTLCSQHSADMTALKDRTLVFGRRTGVNYKGDVVLSFEDVRHNWLNLIQTIHKYNELLDRVPESESRLSQLLRNIQISHHNHRSGLVVQNYLLYLDKLTNVLIDLVLTDGYPDSWPKSLAKYHIIVESEQSSLMLTPNGHFLVPASSPAFLFVDFISENLNAADRLLDQSPSTIGGGNSSEADLVERCKLALMLESVDKDDNISTRQMIRCCQLLLDRRSDLFSALKGNRIKISSYYSIQEDGEIFIPWNCII